MISRYQRCRAVGVLLCLIFSGPSQTEATTSSITAVITPSPARVGNHTYTVKCVFTMRGSAALVDLMLIPPSEPEVRLAIVANNITPGYYTDMPDELFRRMRLEGSIQEGYLSMVVNATRCRDHRRTYKCLLRDTEPGTGIIQPPINSSATMEVKGLIVCKTDQTKSCPHGSWLDGSLVIVQCYLLTCGDPTSCTRGPPCSFNSGGNSCPIPAGCRCSSRTGVHTKFDYSFTALELTTEDIGVWRCREECPGVFAPPPANSPDRCDNGGNGDCPTATITITPEVLTLPAQQSDTGGRVTVTCQTSGVPPAARLAAMRILRTSGNTHTALVSVSSGSQAVLDPSSGLTSEGVGEGSTASGEVTLTMSQARCNRDDGVYTCLVTVIKASPQVSVDVLARQSLTIQVSPGQASLTVQSSGNTNREVGDTLTMTCEAVVGTVHANTEIRWVWEWQQQPRLSSRWHVYDGSPSDIRNGPRVQKNCYERRSSTLSRELILNDTNRCYRCYIRKRESPDPFRELTGLAAEHAVGTVTHAPPGPVTLTATPPDKTSWTVGDTLTLTCDASVGTVDANTQVQWVWEWLNTQHRFTSWHDYDGNSTDIREGPIRQTDRLHQRRSSTLTRQLTANDTRRQYRCYVRRRQGLEPFVAYDQKAAVHAVGTVFHAAPGQATLTAKPNGITHWVVGDTLAMTCEASVGTVDSATQIQWVWEWRKTQDELTIIWSAYDGNPADIQDGPTTQQGLYQHRNSTLTRQLTVEDTNREYRCYVRRRQGQGAYTAHKQFAAQHAVGTVTFLDDAQPIVSTSPSTVNVSTSATGLGIGKIAEAQGDDVSLIRVAGIVVGVILLILLVVVVVCAAFWYDRRNPAHTEHLSEGEFPAGDEIKPEVLGVRFGGLYRPPDQESDLSSTATSSTKESFETGSSWTASSRTESSSAESQTSL